MPENLHITLETPSAADDERLLHHLLAEYNRSKAGDDRYQPLHLILREDSGRLVGGLLGDTYWGWLAINILWLREDLRGQGYGSRLLRMAEEEAIRRGCTHAHLDTFDFQALDFYRKYGYAIFGQIDGLPPGHTRYFMQKSLQ